MSIRDRTTAFCDRFGLRVPILLAPMAGASAPALSIAVANAGGLGACGALLMTPRPNRRLGQRSTSSEQRQIPDNLDPEPGPPMRNADHETQVREFLATWGPTVAPDAGDATPPDFGGQCEALLEGAPSDCFLGYGGLSAGLRGSAEGPWHLLVCQHVDGGRGESCRGCRRGRDRSPRHGGGRPSRLLRREQGRARDGRLDLARSGGGRRRQHSGCRYRRYCRWPRGRRCDGSRRECRAGGHGLPAGAGGADSLLPGPMPRPVRHQKIQWSAEFSAVAPAEASQPITCVPQLPMPLHDRRRIQCSAV